MPLSPIVKEEVEVAIKELEKTGTEEIAIPDSPLLVTKKPQESDMVLFRKGEYAVVQRGI